MTLACGLSFPSVAYSQRPSPAPILGEVGAITDPGILGSASALVRFSDGGVLVNDLTRRQVVLFDAGLKRIRVVADTSAATERAYAGPLAGLIRWHGDSALFIEPRSLSMLVIDPKGGLGRVMAAPKPADIVNMIGGPFGAPGIDAQDRIVYRGTPESNRLRGVPPNIDSLRLTALNDSAPVVRASLTTRAADTVGYVHLPRQVSSARLDKNDRFVGLKMLTNPAPVIDDWTLMPDGRVAIVRGADFHVDWVETDGRVTRSKRIDYAWESLDDAGRKSLLDSARAEADRAREAMKAVVAKNPMGGGPGVMVVGTAPNDQGKAQQLEAMLPVTEFIDASALPSYRPAFRMGSTRVDPQGRLWVRTTRPTTTGSVYAVIDGNGQLVGMVTVPKGREVVGFGDAAVYLAFTDEAGVRIEAVALREHR